MALVVFHAKILIPPPSPGIKYRLGGPEHGQLTRPEAHNSYDSMRNLKWSGAEKAIARKAFEHALQEDLEAVMQRAKKMAEKIEQPSALWDLERYLTQRRNEIDRRYDYRYSVLPEVFGDLIRRGRLREEDLCGLGEDKLRYVRACMSL
jgi:Photoprotection regulator fluorescence recovery protein